MNQKSFTVEKIDNGFILNYKSESGLNKREFFVNIAELINEGIKNQLKTMVN